MDHVQSERHDDANENAHVRLFDLMGLHAVLNSLKNYVSLIKTGIVIGNLVSFLGAFFIAAKTVDNLNLLLMSCLGISLIVACGCVFNNCIDQDIDAVMQRTNKRVLVKKLISTKSALVYASILGIMGTYILSISTNWLAVSVALFGLFVYVVLYSLWAKRHSVYGTFIGSVSGAAPPVVAYCAVTGQLDLGAVILFLILYFWQIPHFYAIAIFRFDDYKNAKIPVLPVKKGLPETKLNIFVYIIAFTLVASMLSVFGYTGLPYLLVTLLIGGLWLRTAAAGFRVKDNKKWAYKIFGLSIVAVMALNFMMVVNVQP